MAEQHKDPIKTWQLPSLDDAAQPPAPRTNALNKSVNWVYEPPEEQADFTPQMPTMEEIESIRQAAWEEGLKQGKEAGYQEGLQKGLQQGHAEGLQQGLEQGLEEGQSTGREQVQQQAEQLAQLITALQKPLAAVDKQLEAELVQLAVALARAVVRTEPATQPDILLQALNEAMKVLPMAEKRYQIRMHPDDVSILTQHFGEEHIKEQHWQLLEVPDMRRGGVDVVTDNNAVDVSIERRCRDVLDKFLLDNGLGS